MSNNHPADLILRHTPMQHQTKSHQDPGQVGRREDQQPQERQPRLRIPPAPDIDQATTQRRTEERYRQQGRKADEEGDGVKEQP